jgi:antitoxin MazE
MATDRRIHEFVTPQRRGLVALPSAVRERLHLDQPGVQVEFVELDDGRIEVRGTVPVPSDQAWFWTERWQAMEREVDEHVAAGRVETFASVDEFLDALDY